MVCVRFQDLAGEFHDACTPNPEFVASDFDILVARGWTPVAADSPPLRSAGGRMTAGYIPITSFVERATIYLTHPAP